ncbi:hypothetical protein M0804_014284 [Polistes exclamans]|nr:hypothetical protein M0804_014286 [Polistes exclamans]KAI4475476.1 hypothetical protein M0804_014284 [Polistes exclamans]
MVCRRIVGVKAEGIHPLPPPPVFSSNLFREDARGVGVASPAFTNVPPIPKSITDSVELCRLARDPGIYTGLTLNTSHRGEISSRGNN